MMGEDLCHPIVALGRECLQIMADSRMIPLAVLFEQAPVDDLLHQRVLEGQDMLGEETGLIKKLHLLQVRKSSVQGIFCKACNSLEQGQRHVYPNDRGCLEEALCL